MNFSLVLASFLVFVVTLVSSVPLDLSFGGVYNDDAANDYWARRFGSGFFANLANLQRGGISSTPKRASLRKEVATPTEATPTEATPIEEELPTGKMAMTADEIEPINLPLDYFYYDSNEV